MLGCLSLFAAPLGFYVLYNGLICGFDGRWLMWGVFSGLDRELRESFGVLGNRNGVARVGMTRALGSIHGTLLSTSIGCGMTGAFASAMGRGTLKRGMLATIGPDRLVIGVIRSRLARLVNKRAIRVSASNRPTIVLVSNLRNSNGAAFSKGLTQVLGAGGGHGPLLMTYSICHPTTVRRLHMLTRRVRIPVCSRPSDGGPMRVTRGTVGRTGTGKCSLMVISATKHLTMSRRVVGRVTTVGGTVGPGRVLFIMSSVAKRSTIGATGRFGSHLSFGNMMLAGLSNSAHNNTTLSVHSIIGGPVGFMNANRGLSTVSRFRPTHVTSHVLNVNSVISLMRHTRRRCSRRRTGHLRGGVTGGRFSFGSFLDRVTRVGGVNGLGRLTSVVPNMKGTVGSVSVSSGTFGDVRTVVRSVAPTRHSGPRVLGNSHHAHVTGNDNAAVRRMGHLLGRFSRAHGVVGVMANDGVNGVVPGVGHWSPGRWAFSFNIFVL